MFILSNHLFYEKKLVRHIHTTLKHSLWTFASCTLVYDVVMKPLSIRSKDLDALTAMQTKTCFGAKGFEPFYCSIHIYTG